MFSNLRLKIAITIIVFAALAGVSAYAYIKGSSIRINRLEREQIELQHTAAAQEAALEQNRQDMLRLATINAGINDTFRNASNGLADLNRRMRAQDLRGGAQRDPTETELIVNRDAAFTARCNEIVTGSPITEADVGNTICPDLVARNS